MKQIALTIILGISYLFIHTDAKAQWGRYHRHYPVFRPAPVISLGIGAGFRSYGFRPGVAVNVGVVVPPVGARVRGLPPDAIRTEINGIVYYQHNGLFLRERQDAGFEVVEAPIGGRVNRLPVAAKLTKIEGRYYYQKDGIIYYKHSESDGGDYEIVGRDGVLQNGEGTVTDNNEVDDMRNVDDYADNEAAEAPPGRVENDAKPSNDKYITAPQVGDRLDRLPRDSKLLKKNGKTLYQSPGGVYYKEVMEGDKTFYEVVEGP
ncbi:DUF6515 family protein [Niabella insulamsoli]|uniref:DUF6515 family protein n=1 Tax=Niabella insulamsoli TaxID=3144874 RepID=UPI0031FDDCB0